ncbi:SPOR domain-containing protein [soil metagenome]
MDQPLKQRLIGAAVLAALAVIFLPMLLKGPDVREPDAAEVPLSMPPTPGQDFETRELPLTAPEPAPPGGVLGMPSGAAGPASAGDAVVPDDAVAQIPPPDGAQAAVAAAGSTPLPAPKTTTTPVVAPPAAAIAPGSESAATGGGDYVVNLGTFGDRANAQALLAKLRAAGLPVLEETVSMGAGNGTRVRVGPYADRAAAEAGRLRAQGSTSVAGSVVALDAAPAAKPAPKPPAPTVKPAPAKVAAALLPTPPAPPAPPALPAPPASAPPAVRSGFAVQLSAPAAEADAVALRDKARAAGLTSFVQRVDTPGGVRYRVRVGPYADRASADAALGAVNAKLGTHGIVMRHP